MQNCKPEVTRRGALDMQICVPADYTDADAVAFANMEVLCGTDHGWQIVRKGDRFLAGDDERVPCQNRAGFVHIMVCA